MGVLTGPLDPQLRLYGDVLGFRETWRGSRDGHVLNWVNFRVPDGSDYLELMLYAELPPPGQRGSQNHICLEVDDLTKAADRLSERAARVPYARPLEVRTGINRKRQLNVFDPDDTVDEIRANMLGWETCSYPDLKVLHHRPTQTASGHLNGYRNMGIAAYFVGYHPTFLLARALRCMSRPPYIMGGLSMLYGYLGG